MSIRFHEIYFNNNIICYLRILCIFYNRFNIVAYSGNYVSSGVEGNIKSTEETYTNGTFKYETPTADYKVFRILTNPISFVTFHV